MTSCKIESIEGFDVEIEAIASDKSISHRCALFSLLSDKPSHIKNYLRGEDALNSLKIVESLGATIQDDGKEIVITPPKKLQEPTDVLECGNSGTTMRLFCGFLASSEGFFVLSGDKYLRRRPMKRVVEPLRSIGATIDGRDGGSLAPLAIRGKSLEAFDFTSSIASAQVKSAMILAGLKAKSRSLYKESELTRNHSEKMLVGMGASVFSEDEKIVIEPLKKPLNPLDIEVPSDPSSAFFFAVATVLLRESKLVLKNILLNKTRIEAFMVLKKMGVSVEFELKDSRYEDIGDISICRKAPLKAVVVEENISWLIDEIPALAILMAEAEGRSVVKNAKELRVKESDRISAVVDNLRACDIDVEEFEDGFAINGGKLQPALIDSRGDHRIAMSFMIAGLKSSMEIDDIECVNTSFPNFFDLLGVLGVKYQRFEK
ncbi:MAG: 3-phosphoshikimate 1-carboxyvinyltransferase [Campylobacterales bacterium]